MHKPHNLKNYRCLSGFTLIEMMIVVAVIAILMLIAIPNYFTARSHSETTVCIGQLRRIQDAKERWAMENHKVGTDTPTMANLVTAYIKTTPICPAGGAYTVGQVSDSPTCDVPGHKLY